MKPTNNTLGEMGKKRKFVQGKGSQNHFRKKNFHQNKHCWDNLPWQKADVPNFDNENFDELYENNAEEEEGILFSFEEISGDAYVLEKDEMGGVQIKAKSLEDKDGNVEEKPGKKRKKKKKSTQKKKGETQTESQLGNNVDAKVQSQGAEKTGPEEIKTKTKDSSSKIGGNDKGNTEPGAIKSEQASGKMAAKTSKKEKKKKKQKTETPASKATQPVEVDEETGAMKSEQASGKTTTKTSKKEKKKKKQKAETPASKATQSVEVDEETACLSEKELAEIKEWASFNLHGKLMYKLHAQKFIVPTPIQKIALPAALLEGKDVIGAAETGSGKTLAFGLPMIHTLLKLREQHGPGQKQSKLKALVLTPTRELALQVVAHLNAVIPSGGINGCLNVVGIVGGLAEQKQERLLKRKPEIVVATPGRFWELVSGGNEYLSDLACLNFLVIDEADRMVQEGHFPEMEKLFERIKRQEKRKEELQEMKRCKMAASKEEEKAPQLKEEDALQDEDYDEFGLLPGEFEVEMLDPSVLEKLEEVRQTTKPIPFEDTEFAKSETVENEIEEDEEEGDGSKFEVDENEQIEGYNDFLDDEKDALATEGIDIIEIPVEESTHKRQTFVYSATLMLDDKGREHNKKGKKWKKSQKKKQINALQRIMKMVGLRGKPAVIDVTRSAISPSDNSQPTTQGPSLPDGLILSEIKCLQNDKDTHVYYFLLQYPGRTIVFVNAISQARRLSSILQTLNLPAKALHAQMQQRQRLKSMDHIKSNKKAILICTDVAARGLDIPNVEHVIHFDLARSAEIFIHRSGRTARAQKTGISLSIVSPHDEKYHQQTLQVLKMEKFQRFPLDPSLLPRTRERVNLAVKVVKMEEKKSKISSTNSWFRQQAEAMDIDLDEDLLEEETSSSQKSKQTILEAEKAKRELQVMLSQPLFKDKRKFINIADKLTSMNQIEGKSAKGDLQANTRKHPHSLSTDK